MTEEKVPEISGGEHGKRIICYTEPCSSIILSPPEYKQIFILDDDFTNTYFSLGGFFIIVFQNQAAFRFAWVIYFCQHDKGSYSV